jgi:hypothetical protein
MRYAVRLYVSVPLKPENSVQKYPWFYLLASILKILSHGTQSMNSAVIPVVQMFA